MHGIFALPDEDAAEAVVASATHRISAIQLGAAQAFVNTAGLNKLRELYPLLSMHPQVDMRCLPAGLRKSVAGCVCDDPAMTSAKTFDLLRNDF